jgi:hypothetical protein
MTQPQQVKATAASAGAIGSLRDEMERRRAAGTAFSLPEAVALIVPLSGDLRDRHARGERFFAHPSSIFLGRDGRPHLDAQLSKALPSQPRDRACLAPEERHGEAGDARSSVFAIGAMLYELLTAESVGPGMRRPTEIIPGLDPGIELVLGKALVTDRAHRPDDVGALAVALHHFAPTASMPPPAADESHLDTGADFQVDVSLSMLPPARAADAVHLPRPPQTPVGMHAPGADPMAMPVMQAPPPAVVRRAEDPTTRLADLKGRLESDPRPRYVVIKDGMDHGPFNAVELLQQIASHKFLGKHVLRDSYSGDEKPIAEWDEFSQFAEQSKLNREIVAEKKAIDRVVVAEAKGTRQKMFFGVAVVAGILAIVGTWWFVKRGSRSDAIEVAGDEGLSVDVAGGLKGDKTKGKPGARVGTAAGGFPILSGGMSCEQARARYIEEISIGGKQGQADLTAGQLGQVLNNGSYIIACGTPQSTKVTVCAAIQNGRAVGVTITTNPPDGRVASCIAGRVRGMSFPSNPKLDITTTQF